MYEHVYYRKKDVKNGTSTSIIVKKKMYEHVYYRKKDARARLLLRARLL